MWVLGRPQLDKYRYALFRTPLLMCLQQRKRSRVAFDAARIPTLGPNLCAFRPALQDNGAGAPIHFATTYKQLDMVGAGKCRVGLELGWSEEVGQTGGSVQACVGCAAPACSLPLPLS